jgi:hypothetical protein
MDWYCAKEFEQTWSHRSILTSPRLWYVWIANFAFCQEKYHNKSPRYCHLILQLGCLGKQRLCFSKIQNRRYIILFPELSFRPWIRYGKNKQKILVASWYFVLLFQVWARVAYIVLRRLEAWCPSCVWRFELPSSTCVWYRHRNSFEAAQQ